MELFNIEHAALIPAPLLIVGALALFLSIVVYWRPRIWLPDSELTTQVGAMLCMAASAVVIALAVALVELPKYDLRSALRAGDCKTVAGNVTDFSIQPISRSHFEAFFTVGGVKFHLSDGALRPGFNRPTGVLREGDFVRIDYCGGAIARLFLISRK